MTHTVDYEFVGNDDDTMQVTVAYDTGWNEGLQCSGKGGWTARVHPNEHGECVFKFHRFYAEQSVVVSGVKTGDRWRIAVSPIDEAVHETGFSVEYTDTGVKMRANNLCSHEFKTVVPRK